MGYGEYQRKHEDLFLKTADTRQRKVLPSEENLTTELSVGGDTISGNGEKVSLDELFLKAIIQIVSARTSTKNVTKAFKIWWEYLRNDQELRLRMRPIPSVLQGLRLSQYVKDYEEIGENDIASIKLFKDETKMVFEFANFVVETYKDSYGISLDDFSVDEKFERLMKAYLS